MARIRLIIEADLNDEIVQANPEVLDGALDDLGEAIEEIGGIMTHQQWMEI